MKLSLDPSPEICFWRSQYWFKGPSNQSRTQRSVTYHEMGYLTCGNRCVICLLILWSKLSNGWWCVQTEINRWTVSAVCLLSPHLYKHISAYKWRICSQGKRFLNWYHFVSKKGRMHWPNCSLSIDRPSSVLHSSIKISHVSVSLGQIYVTRYLLPQLPPEAKLLSDDGRCDLRMICQCTIFIQTLAVS